MTVLAANIPDNSGYVVAAYLVFLLLLIIYLAITAYRLTGLERRIGDLTAQVDAAERSPADDGADDAATTDPSGVREHSA